MENLPRGKDFGYPGGKNLYALDSRLGPRTCRYFNKMNKNKKTKNQNQKPVVKRCNTSILEGPVPSPGTHSFFGRISHPSDEPPYRTLFTWVTFERLYEEFDPESEELGFGLFMVVNFGSPVRELTDIVRDLNNWSEDNDGFDVERKTTGVFEKWDIDPKEVAKDERERCPVIFDHKRRSNG